MTMRLTPLIVFLCALCFCSATLRGQLPPLPTTGTYTDPYGRVTRYEFTFDDSGYPLTSVVLIGTRRITASGFYGPKKLLAGPSHPLIPELAASTSQVDSLDRDGRFFDTLSLTIYDLSNGEARRVRGFFRNDAGDLEPSSVREFVFDSVLPVYVQYQEWTKGSDTVVLDERSYTLENGLITSIIDGDRRQRYEYDSNGLLTKALYENLEAEPYLIREFYEITLKSGAHLPHFHGSLEYHNIWLYPSHPYDRIRIKRFDLSKQDTEYYDNIRWEYNDRGQRVKTVDTIYVTEFEYYPDGVLKQSKSCRRRSDHRGDSGSVSVWFKRDRVYEGEKLVAQIDSFRSIDAWPDTLFHFSGRWDFGYEPLAVSVGTMPRSTANLFFPNPASSSITLASEVVGEINVYTMLGQRVLSQLIDANYREVDINKLVSGCYLASVRLPDGEVLTQPLMIIR